MAELRAAEAAVTEARRNVTAAIVAKRRAGMPVPDVLNVARLS
ncbi:hypothetical protein [Streptomyces sp. SID12501]|nr:hypothetical protein [Streptomyces sp. SID12501]